MRKGESIAAPLRTAAVFTPLVVSMIEVGEETGKLPEVLTKIADNFKKDVDNAVAGITSIIEPVLIVFLAVVVGFMAISMFLPLIEVIKQFTEIGPGTCAELSVFESALATADRGVSSAYVLDQGGPYRA